MHVRIQRYAVLGWISSVVLLGIFIRKTSNIINAHISVKVVIGNKLPYRHHAFLRQILTIGILALRDGRNNRYTTADGHDGSLLVYACYFLIATAPFYSLDRCICRIHIGRKLISGTSLH